MRARLVGLMLVVGLAALVAPGMAQGAEGGCANEALRVELGDGFLPDCRAYEMVTPPYKEGAQLEEYGFSRDGDRVVLNAVSAALAGTEGESEATFQAGKYMSVRTADGWRLESIGLPASRFVGGKLITAEPETGVSLWMTHTPEQSVNERDLYIRSAGGSSYSLVGPLADPENSAGEPGDAIHFHADHALVPLAATSDYGHVVLRALNYSDEWPFDETGTESLYEYSGTGNSEPILVAVSGGKGSRSLLAKCGEEPGSRETQQSLGSMYNALSSDGETVFFTLFPCNSTTPVDELWARLHGAVHSGGIAESVDVSARAPESACSGACQASVEKDKIFEGASEDGDRVFFTSTQQLLNGAVQDPEASDTAQRCSGTTGAGGCSLYEYDFNAPSANRLRLIAGGGEVLNVARIAEDGSRVYFVAKGALTTVGNEFGAKPVVGQPNLYVYDTLEGERVAGYRPVFIATLSFEDYEDWEHNDERPVQATPNGGFFVFPSLQRGLTPDDTATTTQLFEYDAQTQELVRVSQGEDGYAENGNSATAGVYTGLLISRYGATDNHTLTENTPNVIRVVSDDGSTVAFTDAGRLSVSASSAERGCWSVYEYHSSGPISNGSVHLVSDGVDTHALRGETGECGSSFKGMDPSGDNIFVETADPLSASDVDGGQLDLYDARVNGGFPVSVGAPECSGESCLGASAGAPGLASPSSAGVAGEGSPSPASTPSSVRAKPKVRAWRLARALRMCRRRRGRARRVCETSARQQYRVAKAGRVNGRGK